MRSTGCLMCRFVVAWVCCISPGVPSRAETIADSVGPRPAQVVSDLPSICWRLVRRDARDPGPGRWIARSARDCQLRGQDTEASAATVQPVIRPGEELDIEEHTAIAEIHLRARSLGYARAGEPIRVQISPLGSPFGAIAVGPGRAVLSNFGGAR